MSMIFLLLLGSAIASAAILLVAFDIPRKVKWIAVGVAVLSLTVLFWILGDATTIPAIAVRLVAVVSMMFVPLIALQLLRERRKAQLDATSTRTCGIGEVAAIGDGFQNAWSPRSDRTAAGRFAAARDRFEEFARQSRAGLWIQDVASHELIWVSPAFESIWGCRAEDLYEDPQRRIAAVHEEDRARVIAGLARAGGGEFAEEYRVQRPDGSVVWVWDHAVPVRDSEGKVVSLAGFAEDITRRKGVEEVNLFRANFVANMSHEVRTPLNIMIGYLEFLLDGTFGDLTPQQREVTERVRSNAEELLELMSASLDLSRLDNQTIPLVIDSIDLADLFGEVVGDVRAIMEGSAVEIGATVDAEIPLLQSDRQKLKMILKNLLSNAVKFTKEGRIEVAAAAVASGIELTVSDTGSGIRPELLPRVFEPFRQGVDPEARASGVGLGLYIVRRLVDILEGRISVESTIGQGATFRVWLPIKLSAEREFANGDDAQA